MLQTDKQRFSNLLGSHTKRGYLTDYSLSRGYVERAARENVTLSLWKEQGCFHVRAHDYKHGRLFWDSFDTLTKARTRFKEARARYRLTRL